MIKEVFEYLDSCLLVYKLSDTQLPRNIKIEANEDIFYIDRRIRVSGQGIDSKHEFREFIRIAEFHNRIQVNVDIHENDRHMKTIFSSCIGLLDEGYEDIKAFGGKLEFQFETIERFSHFFNLVFWKPLAVEEQSRKEWREKHMKV